jgi:hypothetical protein
MLGRLRPRDTMMKKRTSEIRSDIGTEKDVLARWEW